MSQQQTRNNRAELKRLWEENVKLHKVIFDAAKIVNDINEPTASEDFIRMGIGLVDSILDEAPTPDDETLALIEANEDEQQ